MSQFFKALEQAERDRLREKESGGTARPAPPATAPDNAVRVTEATVVAPPPRPAPPAPEVFTPAPKPVPRPDVGASTPPPEAPAPASVFRPVMRSRDAAPRGRRGRRRQPLLIAHSEPGSIEAEAFRTIRAKIELMAAAGRAYRHVAITSVTNGDGKSTSVANLAVVSAQGGRRVCLVDGDLRRPTLHDLFGLPNVDGLASALAHGKPLHTVAKMTDIENLSIVVAGRGSQESFQDLLTPQRLEKLLKESEPAFDLVLFDTPPVFAVADALNVAAACDGVVLVVRAGSVPFSVLRRAVDQIGHVKGRVLGVLLNRVDLRAADADFYKYYRAYHSTRPKA